MASTSTKAGRKVYDAFFAGEEAHDTIQKELGVSRLHTDGTTLFSYRLQLAKWMNTGERLVAREKIPGKKRAYIKLLAYEECPTVTTRRHQSAVEAIARQKGIPIDFVQAVGQDFSLGRTFCRK